jgi:quinone-modifying oxidoreductase subunit QmoC
VLAAVRHETVQHYAVPQVLGRLAGQVKYLPLLLVVPAVLLLLALLLRDPLWGALGGVLQYMHHPGFYSDLYPHWLLIGFFSFFWGLACLAGAVGVVRFWMAMKAADEAAGRYAPALGIVPSLVRVVTTIFRHDKFTKCTDRASRRWAHLGAFYGFAALFLVSVWAVVALYMINPVIAGHENDLHYPFGFFNPWKLLANLGAVALIAGTVLAIRDRMNGRPESGASTSFDWIFVWLLLGVGITGLLTEVLRWIVDPGVYGDVRGAWSMLEYLAYSIYFVHLVAVFGLLVYLPYSKFAHVLYRTAALVYAEHSGRTAELQNT